MATSKQTKKKPATDVAPSPAPQPPATDKSRHLEIVRGPEKTQERAIAGVTHGLIELGDEVTWEARHFGIRQTLKVRITGFERPSFP